ncbi:MAG: hypothetical protein FWF05_04075 [Oscillospiraceae bacterium]|nr:hypothetical protein [Oscillospiraceae bacterium]
MQNQTSVKVNPIVLFVIFIVGLLAALPLRVYQLLTAVEPGTGFWKAQDFTVYIMYAVLAVLVFLFFMISFSYKSGLGKAPDVTAGGAVIGIISLAVAASLVYNFVTRYSNFFELYNAYVPNPDISLRRHLAKTGALSMLLEAAFAVLSGLYFVLYGITSLNKKSASSLRLMAITPVLWCVFRIVHRYMRTISFINVSELFFELLMLVFLIAFFMGFAQVTSKVNSAGIEWKLFAYGMPAALLALICFVPRVVLTLLGKAEFIADGSSIEFCDLTVAAFIVAALVDRARIFSVTLNKGTQKIPDED